MEKQISYEHRLTAVEDLSRINADRIEHLEERQDNLDKLVTSVAAMANEQEHIKTDVTEIKTDVKALTEKSGKRWDGMVDKVIWAVLAALIAFFLGRLGL